MKYTVEHGHAAVGQVDYYAGLGKSQAITLARQLATGSRQVYVTWLRQTDGQHGYLNADGNYAITGQAW